MKGTTRDEVPFRRRPLAEGTEYRQLREARLRGLVPVEQPLLLISQVQRSGGTLLLRLLDGHPECHVVPFQLRRIDDAAKRRLTDPEQAWLTLHDPKLERRFRSGHQQIKHDVLRGEETFSFLLPPGLQRTIYDACVAQLDNPSTRDLFDCYFTSYFNGWLDYRNLRLGVKRWVVGFEPGVARSTSAWRSLQQLYRDGRTIAIVRDPWSWYASARRWEPRWRDREYALEYWCRTAKGTLKWKKKKNARVYVLSFADLLTQTEETVRRLAAWLDIRYVPELLVPTFNGLPISANTSFGDLATEVSTKPLERAREELDDDDVAYIEKRARGLYERLLAYAREQ
jgi:hypothetical protein